MKKAQYECMYTHAYTRDERKKNHCHVLYFYAQLERYRIVSFLKWAYKDIVNPRNYTSLR